MKILPASKFFLSLHPMETLKDFLKKTEGRDAENDILF